MKKYWCPAEDFTCPHYRKGTCTMDEENMTPVEECDVFYGLTEDEIKGCEYRED